ncbi:MAG: sodium:solute symporter family protein [Cryomorphaceae bacterium]|nr:Na+:solute symporter [Flavobacteriales bacterium]
MALHYIDWLIIVGFLLFSLLIGLYFRKRASKSLESFFLGDRSMPWLVAGISMVATTFAADTPLAVTELVGQNGISGNWLWWSFLAGGMLTTFFFAKLWRRAGVLTEIELIELRYGGRPAAILRGFKAVYLGLFMNVLIIGWVNLAMITILTEFFAFEPLVTYSVLAGLMLLAAAYTALSGIWGVAVTDVVQFCFAILGTAILAYLVVQSPQIGGISGLKEALPPATFNFLPQIGEGSASETLAISFGAFFAYMGVQWWSSWYPGQEPGGGGYVAQRMMSTKTEKGAVYATLLFQVAHYCLRPWPWILVALCCLVLYPNLEGSELRIGYVRAMKDFLPTGLKGVLLAAFLAAYLSTISTQLNWGAGYLVNDFWKRFVRPDAKQRTYVIASQVVTLLLMASGLGITFLITSISGVWQFILECGAGLGLVLILRWYWWRINAWSEITATVAPFLAYAVSRYALGMEFPNSFFLTVGFTTLAWIAVTYLTRPETNATLIKFYERVRPDGNWRVPGSGITMPKSNIGILLVCWLSAVAFTYGVLFLTGKLIFAEWIEAAWCAGVVVVSAIILKHGLKQNSIWH